MMEGTELIVQRVFLTDDDVMLASIDALLPEPFCAPH
jgi:hypothetical protein